MAYSGSTTNLALPQWVDTDAISHLDFNTGYSNIDAKFAALTGHKHTGAIGDASQIPTGGLADGAITTIKLADLSVGTTKLIDLSVSTAKLADLSVSTAKLADDSVTNAKIGALAVNTTELADGAVTDVKAGNRTADQAIATASGNTGTLTQLFSWIAKAIKGITGGINWYDAPANTLSGLNNKFDAAAGHKHTGAAGDAPPLLSTGLADGAATDAKVGNRTADPAIATAYSNTGTLTQLFSWIVKVIKGITGTTNWYDIPSASLASLWAKFNLTTGHKHTGAVDDAPKIAATDVSFSSTHYTATNPGAALDEAYTKILTPPKCFLMNDVSVPLGANSSVVIPFGTEIIDTHSMHDSITNNTRITIGIAGTYHIIGEAKFSGADGGVRGLKIRKNGTIDLALSQTPAATGGQIVVINIADLDSFIAGDYIELVAINTATTSSDVVTSSVGPFFKVVRIAD